MFQYWDEKCIFYYYFVLCLGCCLLDIYLFQCMWLIFHIWQMTPLGYAWMLHGNYFINGGLYIYRVFEFELIISVLS